MKDNKNIDAVILGYRRGSNIQYPNQVLLKVMSNVVLSGLIGKKVIYKDKYGNVYRGKILDVHGKGINGVLIATFKPNLPGQAIGDLAKVLL